MTCRIERLTSEAHAVVFRVSGHIQLEHINTLEELVRAESGRLALDLAEVTLADRDVVSFLASCEPKGIQLRNSPAFLREWITKEQQRIAAERSVQGTDI